LLITIARKMKRMRTEKRYWRLRRLESAVPALLALKNVTLRKGRDTLCKVRQSGTCCAEREQPICTASRWQLMESLSGTAVSSTVAIVGSIWPKGPAQAGPAIQAQWMRSSAIVRENMEFGYQNELWLDWRSDRGNRSKGTAACAREVVALRDSALECR